MKLKEINRYEYFKNTKLKRIIDAVSVLAGFSTLAIGLAIYYFKKDKIADYFQKLQIEEEERNKAHALAVRNQYERLDRLRNKHQTNLKTPSEIEEENRQRAERLLKTYKIENKTTAPVTPIPLESTEAVKQTEGKK